MKTVCQWCTARRVCWHRWQSVSPFVVSAVARQHGGLLRRRRQDPAGPAGLLFGFHRQTHMPRGTSLGEPLFYLRIGNGRDGLVRFEAGTSQGFVYITRKEATR